MDYYTIGAESNAQELTADQAQAKVAQTFREVKEKVKSDPNTLANVNKQAAHIATWQTKLRQFARNGKKDTGSRYTWDDWLKAGEEIDKNLRDFAGLAYSTWENLKQSARELPRDIVNAPKVIASAVSKTASAANDALNVGTKYLKIGGVIAGGIIAAGVAYKTYDVFFKSKKS